MPAATHARTSATEGPAVLVVRDGAAVITATGGWTQLIEGCARDGVLIVLVTPTWSRLSFAFAGLVVSHGVAWVLELEDGSFRSATTGAALHRPQDVFEYPPGGCLPGSADPVRRTHRWVQAVISVHHRPREETLLGRAVELLAGRWGDASPTGWGSAEPADAPWDRGALTRWVRERMPGQARLAIEVSGDRPMAATLRVFRTRTGVIEETKFVAVLADLDAGPGSVDSRLRETAAASLREQATAQDVAFGVLLSHPGPGGILLGPGTGSGAAPLAAALGPSTIRDLDVDLRAISALEGVERMGAARLESVIVSFSGDAAERWRGWGIAARTAGPGVHRRARRLGEDPSSTG